MKRNYINVKDNIKTNGILFLKSFLRKANFSIISWSYLLIFTTFMFFAVLWVIQIRNLQPFQKSIVELQNLINKLENETKNKQITEQQLNKQLEILKDLINNVQKPTLKTQLNQVYSILKTQVDGLPKTVEQKDIIAFRKDLAGLQKDRANSLNSIASSLIQALGGLFLFVTAYISIRNLKVTDDKQIAERFSKAVEMLANKDLLEARLGGIYLLEKIAENSDKYHEAVMKVLTAFIREKCPLQEEQQEIILSKVSEDIQAALTVIAQRNTFNDPENFSLDLSYTSLPKIALIDEAKLNRVNFAGSSLRGAILKKAKLRKANLDNADLTNAILVNADLKDASFDKTNLENTNMKDVKNIKPKQFNTARNLPQFLKEQNNTAKRSRI